MAAKNRQVDAIVQARMGSTRLPGKVLKEIDGHALLYYLIEQLKRSKKLDSVVIATTVDPRDDQIVDFCKKHSIAYIRGSITDVLGRYHEAAKQAGSDVIVRITGDCPLIDPELVDAMIARFLEEENCDYLSNTVERTYPRGFDIEVFSFDALVAAVKYATAPEEREHVTPYLYRHPDRCRIASYTAGNDQSKIRLTVDTIEDFRLIELIIKALKKEGQTINLKNCLQLLKQHPDWTKINQAVKQKTLKTS